MSNQEVAPPELDCLADRPGDAELIRPREVPLGGPRAMTVRRTLPGKERSFVGAWCFADHYGPDAVARSGGMQVPGHPHTGLQTVSWLFEGEIEHRDTTGAHAMVRPGEVNLMTAGSGIAHSEFSTADTDTLHGVQLWVALPDAARFTAPTFEHFVPEPVSIDGCTVLVFIGELAGARSPVTTYTPLLGAELRLPAGTALRLPTDPAFEHGLLVDSGTVTAAGLTATGGELLVQPSGPADLVLHSGSEPARVVLLGGEPFTEEIVMWWNFIGRSHDEVVQFRREWQAARTDSGTTARYGRFPDTWQSTLPAPDMPTSRLRSRRNPHT